MEKSLSNEQESLEQMLVIKGMANELLKLNYPKVENVSKFMETIGYKLVKIEKDGNK
jgi:hypothetical protein